MRVKFYTKPQAIKIYKAHILPAILKEFGPYDRPALRESWNVFTDYLHKEGKISDKQYNTWTSIYI
jgi:hypothetical protein